MKRIGVMMVLAAAIVLLLGSMGAQVVPQAYAQEVSNVIKPTKTALGFSSRRVVYTWNLVKTAVPPSVEIKPGQTATINYTITATRTLVSDVTTSGVRGQICVTNFLSVPTQGLKIVDQIRYQSGGAFMDVPGAMQVIIPVSQLNAGGTGCYPYEIAFTPIPGVTNYKNVAKITVTNYPGHEGTEFGTEISADFVMPAPVVVSVDASATVTDSQVCPVGFTCTPGTVGPWTLTESGTITYTKSVKNDSAACGRQVTLMNTASLLGSSGLSRTASASVAISTGPCLAAGCTPGYWKNHPAAWTATPYSTGQSVGSVFSAALGAPYTTLGASTLMQSLSFQGGSTIVNAAEILLRASTAALLNAGHSGVGYPLSTGAIISQVNGALMSQNRGVILGLATTLDGYNNAGCPLGN